MKKLENFKLEIQKEIEPQNNLLFELKSANEWIEDAKKRPIPKKLFGEFWFENELCILFADTNMGKSILAVQIANSISIGIATCNLDLECPSSKIMYFDFELSDKQFENRYSEKFKNHHLFDSNFSRAELTTNQYDELGFKNFESYLKFSLEKVLSDGSTKILIVDNITYLKNETEKAKDASSLMKLLKELKNKFDLSILVLAHTPKIDNTKEISKNHLAGSKMLMNFCDSSFAIGESFTEVGLRYLKQIKQRNCEEIYGTNNILVYKIEKIDSFLQFVYLENGLEYKHLKKINFEC